MNATVPRVVWCGIAMVTALTFVGTAEPSAVIDGAEAAIVTAQDDGGDDPLPSDAGRIIGSPDAGPDPQHSGDRGGALQFATLGALAVAIGFIAWRVTRASRQRATTE